MRIAQVSFHVDSRNLTPEALLDGWYSLTDMSEAVAAAGHDVSVFLAHSSNARKERSGISYNFLQHTHGSTARARHKYLYHQLRAFDPHVIHVHGLGFSHEVMATRSEFPQTAVLVQDHASGVPRFWRRRAFKRGLAAADGIAFCALEQAEPFRRTDLLDARQRVFEIPEATSRFMPGNNQQARALTQIFGSPAILSVGHLDSNKDPITLLEGVARVIERLPELELWCCYGDAPLLPDVKTRIAADPELAKRVHLLGRVSHDFVERLMQSADLFVLASHREGSSFALIEALATGLEPVVTNIPSLRKLTGDGKVGTIWTRGDAQSLADALTQAQRQLRPGRREHVREFFEATLSSAALGRSLDSAYAELVTSSTRSPSL